ncbi:hypothetical protein [Komagataeibacter swingsii]|uniref:Uncharacterized protein n=1 Tax=Komagataeibacter swingsii TaxID=215220 RepID=A0A850P4L1_9PROT|nr:hypothetical protein [Komagataeibacter swingsii]NVN35781.1 hypothetical protein [Komagataeibacter swingsii]
MSGDSGPDMACAVFFIPAAGYSRFFSVFPKIRSHHNDIFYFQWVNHDGHDRHGTIIDVLGLATGNFFDKLTYNFVFNIDLHFVLYFYAPISLPPAGSRHDGIPAPPYAMQCRFLCGKNSHPGQE